MKLDPGNAQHIGARSEQQDSFGFSDPGDRSFVAHGGVAAVIADGMGGLSNGSAASSTAVRAFLTAYESKQPPELVPEALLRSIQTANDAVLRVARDAGSLGNIGTTLAAAALHRDWLYWVSAGDSRIYYFPAGGKRLVQLTQDHVYAADLQEQVNKGHITRQEASTHPERASLTSYLGLDVLPRIDRSVRAFPVKAGDSVLICSDGLYRALSDDEIADSIDRDARKTCDNLVQRAVAKQIAAQDNITVVLLRCREASAWSHPLVKAASTVASLAFVIAGALLWRNAEPSIRLFAVDRASLSSGQVATLRWSVDNGLVTITPEPGRVQQRIGSLPVSPTKRTTYVLTAENTFGSVRRTVDVDVVAAPDPKATLAPPRIAMFVCDPPAVKRGGAVKLSWNVEGDIGEVRLNGEVVKAADSRTISNIEKATTYTLTAAGRRGATDARAFQVQLAADRPVINQFAANPNSIAPGKAALLKWSVTNASSVRILPASGGNLKPVGTLRVSPAVTTIYTLLASEAGQETVSKLTLTVVPSQIAPVKIVQFKGDKPAIEYGDSSTLTWNISGDARSIVIDNRVGTVKATGTLKVAPTVKTTYTLSAKDAGGATFTQTYTVDVLKPPKIEEFTVNSDGPTPVLRWRISGAERATRIFIEPDIGPVAAVSAPEGLPLKPPIADHYTLTVEGPGSRTDSKSVPVTPQAVVPHEHR